MSTALARVATDRGLPAPDYLSREQVDLIKDQWFRGATDAEFQLSMAVVKRLRLDPLAKQIHFYKQWDSEAKRKVIIAVPGIDGLRLTAQRSGKYRGSTKPEWCGPDGKWVDVWVPDEHPIASRCGVYHADFVEPCYGVAKFSSYASTRKEGDLTAIWKKMPEHMIQKCAEALALRRAFPAELSGVYCREEMYQADIVEVEPLDVRTTVLAQIAACTDRDQLAAIWRQHRDDELRAACKARADVINSGAAALLTEEPAEETRTFGWRKPAEPAESPPPAIEQDE